MSLDSLDNTALQLSVVEIWRCGLLVDVSLLLSLVILAGDKRSQPCSMLQLLDAGVVM